ncbi:hypothetical protein SAY86_030090 [Trapa natans]|uniref:Large ribosomal subunit protein uL6 alpha-beta domain-containing protein n=2 Tax=Trapa TaxID=22665 RepID=A0AAN7RA96_TRANT|nr:hypothetical protein SAY86_030090 [Trapa natans]
MPNPNPSVSPWCAAVQRSLFPSITSASSVLFGLSLSRTHQPPIIGGGDLSPQLLRFRHFAVKRVIFWVHVSMEAQFFRFLKIVGVGYKARAEAQGRLLLLKLGYSHEVELAVPPAVRVFCFKNNVVCCTGIDKQRVHQFAATVRNCKPPEVYKGKGIMYIDEVIKKKQGKKSK